MLKVIVLIDNNKSQSDCDLLCEHGLSIYFEADNKKWLYDVGASGKYLLNALILGIEGNEVNNLILSHGHKDHTGGLKDFLQTNTSAQIFVPQGISNRYYYTYRHERKRDISTDHSLFTQYPSHFTSVKESIWLSDSVALVYNDSYLYLKPKGNQYLTVSDGTSEHPDLFNDEVALAVKTEKGLVVLSACSHNGVLNILQSCANFTSCNNVYAFVGGMHLVDGISEEQDDVESIADEIKNIYPDIKIYTGHCTGENAISVLSRKMKDRFCVFNSGMEIPI